MKTQLGNLLFLTLALALPAITQAATFSRNVSSSSALATALTDYQAGEGYAVRVEPRSKQELIDNPNLTAAQRNAWQNSWAQFDVKLRDNSLHRNDNGNVGIRVFAPDVNYAPPVTPTYYVSYLHSGYNGQSPYSSVDSGLQALSSVNWNDFPYLDSTLCAIQFPTVSSSDVFGSDNSAACP